MTEIQSSQSAVVEEESVWMGFVTVNGPPIMGDVGKTVKSGEFGERQKLGVVKALHEESATWLTGHSVDEQRQSKRQNPRQCHVVTGNDRKYSLNEIRKMSGATTSG